MDSDWMDNKWRVEACSEESVVLISYATMIGGTKAEWDEAISYIMDLRDFRSERIEVEVVSDGVRLSSPQDRLNEGDFFFVPLESIEVFVRDLEILTLFELYGY